MKMSKVKVIEKRVKSVQIRWSNPFCWFQGHLFRQLNNLQIFRNLSRTECSKDENYLYQHQVEEILTRNILFSCWLYFFDRTTGYFFNISTGMLYIYEYDD